MDDNMTQVEFYVFLKTLAENVKLKAKDGDEAAAIILEKAEAVKPKT